jgi:5'-nucleotidase (lipoprotein e(P4) family)
MRRPFSFTMKNLLLSVALFSFACTTTAPSTPNCVPGDTLLNATLWMQRSAEYRANALQAYGMARRALDAALAAPSSSLPPAIILDLDETALDNMGFESTVIRKGITYDQTMWNDWIAREAATGTPGAKEFLQYAVSRGVEPFYITNRRDAEKEHTHANLVKLGYPMRDDALIVRGESDPKDKTSRRARVAATHRVLLLLGDDLNDFIDAASKTPEERDRIIADNAASWGTKWVILPNPVYGSWVDTLLPTGTGTTDCEKKRSLLR